MSEENQGKKPKLNIELPEDVSYGGQAVGRRVP